MRNSGNEHSSVILRQNKEVSKVENVDPKEPNILKPKGWCNKPKTLQFQFILIWKILLLLKRYESTEVDRRTWLHVSSGTH